MRMMPKTTTAAMLTTTTISFIKMLTVPVAFLLISDNIDQEQA